jgi:hypothetical protein
MAESGSGDLSIGTFSLATAIAGQVPRFGIKVILFQTFKNNLIG